MQPVPAGLAAFSLFVFRFHAFSLIKNVTPFAIGKYLVSPLTRRVADDHHTASVSIRSGRGSATTDRVLRFLPTFSTPAAAARYAAAEGALWVRGRLSPEPPRAGAALAIVR